MNGWRPEALSDVLAEAKPGFACGEDVEDGVFQVRMNNITSEGQFDFSKAASRTTIGALTAFSLSKATCYSTRRTVPNL